MTDQIVQSGKRLILSRLAVSRIRMADEKEIDTKSHELWRGLALTHDRKNVEGLPYG
jgi:hypothetical protein